MRERCAAVLSTGDELVLGETLDTNSAWLASRLRDLGYTVIQHATLPDDDEAVAAMMSGLIDRVGVIVSTGGLGPTQDDLTRQALAKLMGEELVEDAAESRRLNERFARFNRPVTDMQRMQAFRPASARCLHNPNGTAPGLAGVHAGTRVYCLPGPPRELKPMFEQLASAELALPGVEPAVLCRVHACGIGEGDAAIVLKELLNRSTDPHVGITASGGVLTIRIRGHDADEVERAASDAEGLLAPYAFGRDGVTLAESIVGSLRARGERITTIESCTGGLIASALTSVAGASDVLDVCFVAYANEAKMAFAEVPGALLERFGAVSEEVVRAMAVGGLKRAGADHAIAVSGIAGPGGGTEEKPVGTVWMAYARRGGEVVARRFWIPGDRDDVRSRSVRAALSMVRIGPEHPLLWEKAAGS